LSKIGHEGPVLGDPEFHPVGVIASNVVALIPTARLDGQEVVGPVRSAPRAGTGRLSAGAVDDAKRSREQIARVEQAREAPDALAVELAQLLTQEAGPDIAWGSGHGAAFQPGEGILLL